MQITELNGVGPKTAALLKKLKIETVEDLFLHYPRRYETHPAPVPISQIVENQKCAVQCVVKKEAVKGNNGLMTLYISDRSGRTSCKWFRKLQSTREDGISCSRPLWKLTNIEG